VEDRPHPLGLLRVDDQPAAARVQVVAEDQAPARPLAPLVGGDLLVARALADDLALELSE
jgi:hypothetical protein